MNSNRQQPNGSRWVQGCAKVALLLGCVWGTLQGAQAQSMVSVNRPTVHLRAGPATSTDVLWRLSAGYPLKVQDRRGRWLKVVDFEGDQGWISQPLTGRTPHHIVKVPKAHLRSGPGTQFRRVGQATYGEVLRTLEKRKSWVHVQSAAGQKAWVSRRLVWGW